MFLVYKTGEIQTTILASIEHEAKMKWINYNFIPYLDELLDAITQADPLVDLDIKKQIKERVSSQKKAIESSDSQSLVDIIVDQINFSLNIKDMLDNNQHASLESVISQKIISLRMFLLAQLGSMPGAYRVSISNISFSDYYIPDNVGNLLQGGPFENLPEIGQTQKFLETIWDSGSRSIDYTVNETFPAENFIRKISEFYTGMNYVPLDYDLCMPHELAGLKRGWDQGGDMYCWIQFWKDENSNLINVNIFSHSDQQYLNVVILYVAREQAMPLLESSQRKFVGKPVFLQPLGEL